MTNTGRTDTGSAIIKASPEKIYAAHTSAAAIATWRPPTGMTAKIYEFNPQEGGTFHMAFIYKETTHDIRGKTTENEDAFKGRFLELVPNKRIVELVEFESADPAFAGEMKITTSLKPVAEGTEVTVTCENVPAGIKKEDHLEGIHSSLKNLAAFTEGRN